MDALLIQVCTSYLIGGTRKVEPQLGLYYLAEYAHQFGYDVKIKLFSSDDSIVNELCLILSDNKCNLVGFYVDNDNQWAIKHIIALLKQIQDGLHVVIGGPQVTGDARLCLKRIPFADVAIVGEGEQTFRELLSVDAFSTNNLAEIMGIAFRDENREIVLTGSRNQVRDIDVFPFPRRKNYTLDNDVSFSTLITGRGCVGSCTFCYEGNKKSNILRLHSVGRVIDEIDYLVTCLNNRRYISFLDDTFILYPERVTEICQHFKDKYKGEIKWFCEARVDILKNHLELLPLMKNAGLIRVQLGGESGSQKVLDAYKKNMTPKQLLEVVRSIYEAGIESVYINFIIGGSFETLETFNETLELAIKILDTAPLCASVGCSLFTPYVGTPMRNNCDRFGLRIIDYDSVRCHDGLMPCACTEELSEYKLLQLKAIFYQEITRKELELIQKASFDDICKVYYIYYSYGLGSEWYERCQTIESIKIYFGAVFQYGYKSFSDIVNSSNVDYAVPVRTKQIISDGEAYLIETNNGKYKCLEGLEKQVYLLSSGKLCFVELLHLINNRELYSDCENIDEMVYDVFRKFDKEYLIVWKDGW